MCSINRRLGTLTRVLRPLPDCRFAICAMHTNRGLSPTIRKFDNHRLLSATQN
jgi:hypothetical protein